MRGLGVVGIVLLVGCGSPSVSPDASRDGTVAMSDGYVPAPDGLGQPCERNSDCMSGLCLPGVMRCTRTCESGTDCPTSWSCDATPGVGSICTCAPAGTELCNGADDDCDGYVDDGATCGGPDEMCVAGACTCGPERMCGGVCCELGCVAGACVTVQQVAVGAAHACALLDDATVRCWGDNDSGQIGDGTRTVRPAPTRVASLDQVEEIAAGGYHTCARRSDGSVWCWGQNLLWRFGDVTYRPLPWRVEGVEGATRVMSGGSVACAVADAGAVWCWGEWPSTSGVNRPPTRMAFSPAREVFGDNQTLCAVGLDGVVSCMGSLGPGRFETSPVTDVAPPSPSSTGGHCALYAGGSASCPGASGLAVRGLGEATHIAGLCARRSDGSVLCAEVPTSLEARSVDVADQPPVAGLGDALDIAAEHAYGCSRVAGGSLRCFDARPNREPRNSRAHGWSLMSGDPSLAPLRQEPVAIEHVTGATAVAVGEGACAVSASGLRCWVARLEDEGGLAVWVPTVREESALAGARSIVGRGSAQYGVVDAAGQPAMYDIRLATIATIDGWPELRAYVPGVAGEGACGWTSAGEVRCRFPAMPDQPAEDVVIDRVVGLSESGVCVVRDDGTLHCLDARDRWSRRWVPIAGIDDAAAAAGDLFTWCVVHADGAVTCMPLEAEPVSMDDPPPTPEPVAGLTGVSDVRITRRSACAIASGRVFCWGHIERSLDTSPTLAIAGLDDVVDVAISDQGLCAILEEGEVRCVGNAMILGERRAAWNGQPVGPRW